MTNLKVKNAFCPISTDVECLHKITIEEAHAESGVTYHWHDCYELMLLIDGNVNSHIEHYGYHLEPGDLIAIRPYEMHGMFYLTDQRYERICINIQSSIVSSLSTERTNLSNCFNFYNSGGGPIRLPDSERRAFIKLAEHISNHNDNGMYGNDVMVNSYLSQLLVMINTVYNRTGYIPVNIMDELARDVMLYIAEHIHEPIALETLSGHFHMSGTVISRRFKQHTGLTIRSYIINERIKLAKKLLHQGKNVSETCYSSGFYDYANFIRSFTKIVGVSPGKFVKTNQMNISSL